MNTNSPTTVANRFNCETARNNCLNALRRSILLINCVRRQGCNELLTLTSFVEKSKILSLILGPPWFHDAFRTHLYVPGADFGTTKEG